MPGAKWVKWVGLGSKNLSPTERTLWDTEEDAFRG